MSYDCPVGDRQGLLPGDLVTHLRQEHGWRTSRAFKAVGDLMHPRRKRDAASSVYERRQKEVDKPGVP